MSNVEWNNVIQERYKGDVGFSTLTSCADRDKGCDCNFCQVVDMMFSLGCPFCPALCAASPDAEGEELVKNWLGRHLAQLHEERMEAYLSSRVEREVTYADGLFN